MVSDMGSTGLALAGKRVRFEPLEHRHVPGLVAASVGDASLYRWSPVPQGEASTSIPRWLGEPLRRPTPVRSAMTISV